MCELGECCSKHAHLIFLEVKHLQGTKKAASGPLCHKHVHAEVTLAGDWAYTLKDEPFMHTCRRRSR